MKEQILKNTMRIKNTFTPYGNLINNKNNNNNNNKSKATRAECNFSLDYLVKKSPIDLSLINMIKKEIKNIENIQIRFKAILSIIENLQDYNNNVINLENCDNDDDDISNNNNCNNNNNNSNNNNNYQSILLNNNIINSMNNSLLLLLSKGIDVRKEVEKCLNRNHDQNQKGNGNQKNEDIIDIDTYINNTETKNNTTYSNQTMIGNQDLLDRLSSMAAESSQDMNKYYQPKRDKPTKYSKELENKPFNLNCYCNICCKVFSRKYDRDRHYRIHLNKQPYSCKVCGAKFVRSDYVINHIRNTSCGQSDYYINKYKLSAQKEKKKGTKNN